MEAQVLAGNYMNAARLLAVELLAVELLAVELLASLLLAGCLSLPVSSGAGLQSTVAGLQTQVAGLSTQNAQDAAAISYLSTRVNQGLQSVQPDASTPVPEVSAGAGVLLEGGACCVGGAAGEPLEIRAAFQTDVPGLEHPVNEMRVLAGGGVFSAEDFVGLAWEAYTDSRVFTYIPPLNWSGYYVCVQYRDAQGNETGVFCDDISVEGNPPEAAP